MISRLGYFRTTLRDDALPADVLDRARIPRGVSVEKSHLARSIHVRIIGLILYEKSRIRRISWERARARESSLLLTFSFTMSPSPLLRLRYARKREGDEGRKACRYQRFSRISIPFSLFNAAAERAEG